MTTTKKSNRLYEVWVSGLRTSTMVRLVADNKNNALASFAFPRGLKTIECDAVHVPMWKRGLAKRR